MGQVGASKTFSMGLEPYPRHFENRKNNVIMTQNTLRNKLTISDQFAKNG